MTATSPAFRPLGYIESRLASRRALVVFIALFAVVVIGGAVLVALRSPGSLAGSCTAGLPCPGPPPSAPPLVNGVVWRSPQLGLRLEYDPRQWTQVAASSRDVTLRYRGSFELEMVVGGATTGEASPTALVRSQLAAIRPRVVSLVSDGDPADQVLGPALGFVPGVGGAYVATATSGQGAETPLHLAILGAASGSVSAYATVLTDQTNPKVRQSAYLWADAVVNSLRWER